MPRRYLIVSAQFLPHVGGVEVFSDNLARTLVEHGDEVAILTSQAKGLPTRERLASGVEVWRVPSLQLMGGRLPVLIRGAEFERIMRDLAATHPDRVLVNTRFYELSLAGAKFAQEQGIPLVVLDHGSDWLTFGNRMADVAVRAYERSFTRRIQAYNPTFAGISARSARWLEAFGIKTKLVIPNSIDAEEFRGQSSRRDYRDEFGIKGGRKLVAFVGRLTPEKGALELARAMLLMDEGYVCLMAGEGFLRQDIEKLGVRNLHLLGNVSRPDLSALLSQADALCLPTRSEGFCTSLLEAAAWGVTPCITSVGGVDEVLGDMPGHGVILGGIGPEELSRGIERAVGICEGKDEHLMQKVERSCSWDNALAALDHAFEKASG